VSSKIGFHASHELYAPSRLLSLVRLAQHAGFRHAMCSDHFHPWTQSQGQSGYAWSWLGAAMGATDMSFGTVCAPGQRYHPAIIAQAMATLAEMFPGRFWTSLGSGEALNESITGDPWPDKPTRNRRLEECAQIIRRLLRGETVTHEGLVRVREARLFSRPAEPPRIFIAAISEETAEWGGRWADGLVTVHGSADDLRRKVDAFRRHAGDKPVFVQAAISYAPTDREALDGARRNWPLCNLTTEQLADLPTPQQMQRHCADITDAQLRGTFRISSSIDQHMEWIAGDLRAGAARVYLHHIGPDMERFISAFGQRVLPEFQ
jgi:probable non-F420 flavinoid oxidoreductase